MVDSGNITISPKPAFIFLAKRHWQAKFDDILVDLRVLEAAYKVPYDDLTAERAREIARNAEAFFKTGRELADWIKEATGVDAEKHIHDLPVENPSALKLCDAIAQTAKHHTRQKTKRPRITARVGMLYNGEHGYAKAEIAWSTPTTDLQTVDALDLAKRCVAEWETYCNDNDLDVHGEPPPVIDFLQGGRRITDGQRSDRLGETNSLSP